MKIEKIKPIPKYILARIKKVDTENNESKPGNVRFYSYLTKNDGELVKITVAVKMRYKQWLYKQVAVHGLNSDICYVKDMVLHYIAGYSVGWFEQGAQTAPRWYESTEWNHSDDKYFDPFAPIVNREYLDKFPEYKYSAVNLYRGVDVLKYLRFYEKYPQIEYLTKMGLENYIFSKQILEKTKIDKHFIKWLASNRKVLSTRNYYVDIILKAYRTGKDIETLQLRRKQDYELSKRIGLKELRIFFKGELEKFVRYMEIQQTNPYSYRDYLHACQYLGLDMSKTKNRYPHDFKRWHDIRIDEYTTAKALKEAEEQQAFYDKFAAVANKYLRLQYDKKSVYMAIIAQKPSDLVYEGKFLNHCVGHMGYDQKFIREESLIFFIRLKYEPETPLVTVEYSPEKHKVLHCYGYDDSTPCKEILDFVNNKWLPYANRKIRQLNKEAA